MVDPWEIITTSTGMISQESTTKDVKLFGYDFRGHTRGTLVVGILITKVQRLFTCFLSTTSEKLFILYKASAAVQALMVCPVRPKVLSSWGITLLEKLRATDESKKLETALSSSVQLVISSILYQSEKDTTTRIEPRSCGLSCRKNNDFALLVMWPTKSIVIFLPGKINFVLSVA